MNELNQIYELLNDTYHEIDLEKNRLIRLKNSTANIREQVVYCGMIGAHAEDQAKINKIKYQIELLIIRMCDDPDDAQIRIDELKTLEYKEV